MIHPRIDELLNTDAGGVDSRYALVIVAAKRARQINDYHHQLGEGIGFEQAPPPLVESRSKNYLTMLRTTVLSGVAALVIAVDWLRFEDPRAGGGRPFLLAVLAIAPALVRPWWARVCAVVVSSFFAVCIAFSVAPQHIATAGTRFERGFLDFYDYRLPFDPLELVRMEVELVNDGPVTIVLDVI